MRATLRWAHADLRTHRGEALFIVLATAGIVASLLLASALFGYATNPWQRVFTQSHGAHVWIHTGPSSDAHRLADVDGVDSVAGPYPRLRPPSSHGEPVPWSNCAAPPSSPPRGARCSPPDAGSTPARRTAWCWTAASPGRCGPNRATPSPCPAPPGS